MSYLLSKSRKDHPDKNGEVQKITPKTANWEYVGFEMYHLQEEQGLTFDTENTETCFVLVAGKATILHPKPLSSILVIAPPHLSAFHLIQSMFHTNKKYKSKLKVI